MKLVYSYKRISNQEIELYSGDCAIGVFFYELAPHGNYLNFYDCAGIMVFGDLHSALEEVTEELRYHEVVDRAHFKIQAFIGV